MIRTIFFLGIILAATFTSCHKKDDPAAVPDNTPRVKIVFENVVDGRPLMLNTESYVNAHGDTFSVKSYNYYISNISLTTDDGKAFAEPESYHLIVEADPASKEFTIENLPKGNYSKIKFMIGVDSVRNVSGAQTGALDVVKGMFWDWHQGYIMARMEGTSPQASLQNMIAFHIGGYSGANNVLRWVTLKFPQILQVSTGNTSVLTIRSNAAEWFKTPNLIDFSKSAMIASEGAEAAGIADNYADMFSIAGIK